MRSPAPAAGVRGRRARLFGGGRRRGVRAIRRGRRCRRAGALQCRQFLGGFGKLGNQDIAVHGLSRRQDEVDIARFRRLHIVGHLFCFD